MNKIILLNGVMAGGKSTIFESLKEKLPNYVFIDRAYFKDNILKGVKKENPALAKQISKETVYNIARPLMKEGYNLVMPEIVKNSAEKFLKDELKNYEINSYFLTCSLEEAKKRDRKRQNHSIRDDVVEKNYNSQKPNEGDIIINTEEKSIEEVLEIILG